MDNPNHVPPRSNEEPPPLPTRSTPGHMDKLITNFSQLKSDPKGWFQALPLWRKALLGLAVVWPSVALLTAIFGTGALTCSDDATKSQVLEVIDSHLETAQWYQDVKAELGPRKVSEIRTLRSNKELGRYACAAKYTFDLKGKTREVDFTYDLDYLEDEKRSRVLVDVKTVKARYVTALMGLF